MLLLPCPKPMPGKSWGDWYFANSLAKAFQRSGVDTAFEFRAKRPGKKRLRWPSRYWSNSEVDLVIRGGLEYQPVRKRPFFIWLISQIDTLTDRELESASHIFVASLTYAKHLSGRGLPVSYLPQCTDPSIFKPYPRRAEFASKVLFVGNRRSYATRPVVDMALNAGADLSVWGRGWSDVLQPPVLCGESIVNADLGQYYSSADVVLNDHTTAMLEGGFVSNRVYDVLACGRPVLTEKMDGFPPDLAPHVYQYTQDTFAVQLGAALTEQGKDRAAVAAYVREKHSFDQRAEQILQTIVSLR